MFRILQCWNVICTVVKCDGVPLTIASQQLRDEWREGNRTTVNQRYIWQVLSVSFACELVGSSIFLFVLSTLISFFSVFLPFHFRAPCPSFLPFFRASSFFFLFLVSLFFENCIGRKLTKAYTFRVHPWIQFSHLRFNQRSYASDKCWWKDTI